MSRKFSVIQPKVDLPPCSHSKCKYRTDWYSMPSAVREAVLWVHVVEDSARSAASSYLFHNMLLSSGGFREGRPLALSPFCIRILDS